MKADDDGPILLHEPSLFEIQCFEIQCGSVHAFRILSAVHPNAARLIRKALDQHRYLAFLFQRDYFGRLDSSPSSSFVPQGLFRPTRCISILYFCSAGIISAARMHLYLALLFHRDYFDRPDASLSNSFAPQRLLYPGQMHLYLALLYRRDYFDRLNASLYGSFVPQGLFRSAECISIWLFCTAGIISTDRMHPITGRPSKVFHASH